MKLFKYIILVFIVGSVNGCGYYSFTGASISPRTKTFQVNRFENNSLLVEPGLEVDFRNALIAILENQTNLTNVNSNGDIVYEGEITDYRIRPTTATARQAAPQNRLTNTVKVHFYDIHDENAELDRPAAFFHYYPGCQQFIGSQQSTAIPEIFERITHAVFNAP